MFAKYNLNFWYKEVLSFQRFFFETLRHMYWVLVIPVFLSFQLVRFFVGFFFEYPTLKKQICPGKWEELERHELNVPPKFF